MGATFEASSYGGNSYFGYKVDISSDGNRIFICSSLAFRTFDWNGSSWSQVGGAVPIFYSSGFASINMSGDGNSVVFGHIDVQANSPDLVKVYELVGNSWQQKGSTIYDNNPEINFGGDTEINYNGNRIIIASSSGYVNKAEIFEWNGLFWSQLGNDLNVPSSIGLGASGIDINPQGNKVLLGSENDIQEYEYSNGSWVERGAALIPPTGFYTYNAAFSNDGNNLIASYTQGGQNTEVVKFFSLTNGIWTQLGNDVLSDNPGDLFGRSLHVDADGERVVIGAQQSIYGVNSYGYAKVYDLEPLCTWEKQANLEVNGESANDQFGMVTKYTPDGNFLISGAPYGDGNGSNSGEVRIFEKSGNSWNQRGGTLLGEAASDQFGGAVAISDNAKYVLVGARYNDDGGSNAGQARMFKWNGSNYVQYGADINGTGSSDYTGFAVDISNSGKYFVVGSPYNDDAGSNSGKVQLYKRSPTNHFLVGPPIYGSSNNEFIGRSLCLSGFGWRLAIGAIYNDVAATNAGQVLIYDYSSLSNAWSQVGVINGNNAYDYFGGALSFSADDNTISIGAYNADPNGSSSGQVEVFTLSGPAWIQKGNSLNGQNSYDRFGMATTLSASGDRLVVGTPYSDLNGSSSGHITVFDYNNGTWLQSGNVITGDSGGDYFGTSVSIVGDGTSIAVGSKGDDNNGSKSGSVQIIETCSSNTKSLQQNNTSTEEFEEDVELSLNIQVNVFPNPTAGLLEITGITAGDKIIKLYESSGALVFHQEITGNSFDIGELPTGIYHLNILHEENQYRLTVIKK